MGLILTGLLVEKCPCIIMASMMIMHRRDSGTVAIGRIGNDELLALESGTVQIFVDNDDGSAQARMAFLGLIGNQSYGRKATTKATTSKAKRVRKPKAGKNDDE